MNFFHPLFNSSKFQIKHLKALAAAANEIEIKFQVQRVDTAQRKKPQARTLFLFSLTYHRTLISIVKEI